MTQFVYRGLSEEQKAARLALPMESAISISTYLIPKAQAHLKDLQEVEIANRIKERKAVIAILDASKTLFGVKFEKGKAVRVDEGTLLHAKIMGMVNPRFKHLRPSFEIVAEKTESKAKLASKSTKKKKEG